MLFVKDIYNIQNMLRYEVDMLQVKVHAWLCSELFYSIIIVSFVKMLPMFSWVNS